MKLTPKMKKVITRLETVISLNENEKQNEVLKDILYDFKDILENDTEYIIMVGSSRPDKIELEKTINRIAEEMNQNEFSIEIKSEKEIQDHVL